MPPLSDEVRAESYRLINLGVRKRLMLPFIPSPAGKAAQLRREHMLHVDSEAVLYGRLQWMSFDLRNRSASRQKVFHRVPVHSHIRVILIAQKPHNGIAIRSDLRMQF